MGTFYFVSYTWRSLGKIEVHYANILIDTFPLSWLIDTKRHLEYEYTILNYKQISEEQYMEYKDFIN